MSVTLKLADKDAALNASILKAIVRAHNNQNFTYDLLGRMVKDAMGGRTPAEVSELSGAFSIAVRANQR